MAPFGEPGDKVELREVFFSRDGAKFAVASEHGQLCVLDSVNLQVLVHVSASEWGNGFATPDGRLLATRRSSNEMYKDGAAIQIYSVETGEPLRQLRGHWKRGVWVCAVSHDSRTLVTRATDWTLRFWNAATGDNLHTIQDAPHACAFNSDSTLLLTKAGMLDVASKRLVAGGLTGEEFSDQRFSDDSRMILSTGRRIQLAPSAHDWLPIGHPPPSPAPLVPPPDVAALKKEREAADEGEGVVVVPQTGTFSSLKADLAQPSLYEFDTDGAVADYQLLTCTPPPYHPPPPRP